MTHRRCCYPEEHQPCGTGGGLLWVGWRWDDRQPPDISGCLVSRPNPWTLIIWEPLNTLAPSPARCSPHCCYINTVIFYARPFIKREWHRLWKSRDRYRADSPGSFEEYDQIDTAFAYDDVVTFEGERFVVNGGHVVWARRKWWMCRYARRQQERAAA